MTALSEPVTKTMVLFFIIPVLCIALGSTTLASDSSGVLLYQKNGVANGDGYGSSVAGCGDVDGDGIADFIVGARATSSYDAGSIFVYSGATGILLFRKDGLGDMQLGFSVSGAGDVNGDGRADFIAGAPFADPAGLTDAGSAFVYSGLDGSLLFEKDGGASGDASGWSVAGVGDIDGDGKSDFIVGSRFAASGGLIDAGSAFVYSGADGSLLYKKSGAAFGDEFGVSVAGIGDVTADGRPDFIIGAWKANPNGAEGAGSVYVYSGLTGSLLYQKNGVGPSDGFGNSTAGAGDVDGDGVADFIVGAPQASPAGLTSAGSAYVYSGSSGALLFQKNGAVAGDRMGFSVAGGGDVNGDSRNDFVISAPNADPNGLDAAGSVFVFSGATGNLIFQKSGTVQY